LRDRRQKTTSGLALCVTNGFHQKRERLCFFPQPGMCRCCALRKFNGRGCPSGRSCAAECFGALFEPLQSLERSFAKTLGCALGRPRSVSGFFDIALGSIGTVAGAHVLEWPFFGGERTQRIKALSDAEL
jgi:hypothetical protein